MRPATLIRELAVALSASILLLAGGCFGSSSSSGGSGSGDSSNSGRRASDAKRKYPLDSIPTTTIKINDHAFRVWLAQEFDDKRPGIVEWGLMHVPSSEIADDQGMLFVFSDERLRGFWMKNTIAPLDIAFARIDGTIVKIWQMPPLTLETFSSIEPVMYALEVKQGTFTRLGIKPGDALVLPDDVFKVHP